MSGEVLGYGLLAAAGALVVPLVLLSRSPARSLTTNDPDPARVLTTLSPPDALLVLSSVARQGRLRHVHDAGWQHVFRRRRFPWLRSKDVVVRLFDGGSGGTAADVCVPIARGRLDVETRARVALRLADAFRATEQGAPLPVRLAPVRRWRVLAVTLTAVIMLVLASAGLGLLVDARDLVDVGRPSEAESFGLRVLEEAGLSQDEVEERYGRLDGPDAFAKGQELMEDGLLRLDVAGLAKIHSFGRIVMERSGPELCAAFAMGDPSMRRMAGEFSRILEGLEEETRDRVVTIMATAVRAAVEGRPLQPQLSGAETERAFHRIEALFGPGDLEVALSYGKPGTSDAAVCAAGRRFYRAVDELRGADRALVLRAVYQTSDRAGA